MIKQPRAMGIEINPKLVGVLFTEKIGDTLRLFCYHVNAEISQFDVPAEENGDNLRALFATLNLEETCTSLILEEVVQGRVYIQKEGEHWLYTVLKTTGDTLPPLNADLGELPWRVIWRSQEAEVLQYGQLGDPEHCFALRTQISEGDSVRLMQNSKAFTNPVSVPRKKVYREPSYLKTATALLVAVGIVAAATLVYAFNRNNSHDNHASAAPATQVQQTAAAVSTTSSCYLLYKHQISGPFPLKTVADLNAAGLLNAEALCRPENSTDWIKPADLIASRSSK